MSSILHQVLALLDQKCSAPGQLPCVSIVIANYNGGRLVEGCLRSVFKTDFPSFEVIVVDNGSTDGSPDVIAEHIPAARLIRLRKNLGFAVANNIGIQAASGKYLVLLNGDTEVEPQWLTRLVEAAERMPETAFLQPKILFLDNRDVINSAGNEIHFAGFGVCRGIATRDSGRFDQVEKIGYASGACVMVSREALQKIGPLDDIFFVYGEDKDWGWRGKMLGYESVYVPTSRVYHKWSAVLGWSPKKMYHLELERIVSISKNYSKQAIALLAPILGLVELGVLAHAVIKGWFREKILAYAHAIAFRKEIARRRKQVFSQRKLPDRLLLREFVYDLQHPYVGRLAAPLNFVCRLYSRLLIFDQPTWRCV